jgi:hypothetical protein
MPGSTLFLQECPVCGRGLQIRVEYLGKRVVCHHCRGQFTARDPASLRYEALPSADALLRRADELLRCASERRGPLRRLRPR